MQRCKHIGRPDAVQRLSWCGVVHVGQYRRAERRSNATFDRIESLEMAMGTIPIFANRNDWRVQDGIDVRRLSDGNMGTSTQW